LNIFRKIYNAKRRIIDFYKRWGIESKLRNLKSHLKARALVVLKIKLIGWDVWHDRHVLKQDWLILGWTLLFTQSYLVDLIDQFQYKCNGVDIILFVK
jgi:hypothetical protein